jgi:Lrp/AsnC family transcriptional regulator for asnA, asnC and gidA
MPKRKPEVHHDGGVLSPLDANIITLLQSNGRRTNTDLASILNVTEGTIRNRISRLIEAGILKFEVWADPIRIGYQTYAFIEIQANPPQMEAVGEHLARFREVIFVGLCTGSFDIHVAALVTSNEHMFAFITKQLNHVDGVLRASTSSVLRIIKRDFEYPVPGACLETTEARRPNDGVKPQRGKVVGNGRRKAGKGSHADRA